MSSSLPRDLPGRTLRITQLEGMYLSDTVDSPLPSNLTLKHLVSF